MTEMTWLEDLLGHTLIEIREYLTMGKCNRNQYVQLMVVLRNAIERYENVRSGCPAGRHVGRCFCAAPREGSNHG